jgi:hypothetical protein
MCLSFLVIAQLGEDNLVGDVLLPRAEAAWQELLFWIRKSSLNGLNYPFKLCRRFSLSLLGAVAVV